MRSKTARQLALAAMLALLLPAAGAQVYRWVDANGRVHYTDQPPPEQSAARPDIKASSISGPGEDFEMKRARENAPLTLITAPECKEPCNKARDFLKRRKVPYTERSVSTPEEIAELTRLSGSKEPLAPSLMVGRKYLEGFAEPPWSAAIDTAGYPKR